MNFRKIFVILSLSLAIGFIGCSQEKKVEAPKEEQVTKNLVPPKAEIKARIFLWSSTT